MPTSLRAPSISCRPTFSIIFCPSFRCRTSTKLYCCNSERPWVSSCLLDSMCTLRQTLPSWACSYTGVIQRASELRKSRQMAISMTCSWEGRFSMVMCLAQLIFANTAFTSSILTSLPSPQSTICTTPFRKNRQTLKSPFRSAYSFKAANLSTLSQKVILRPVSEYTSPNLSLMISAICAAVQGEKMMFSMSCILNPNFLDDFSRVSMVLEIPMRMSRRLFFWKSLRKSSVMGVGSFLKSSSTSQIQTTQAYLYSASSN